MKKRFPHNTADADDHPAAPAGMAALAFEQFSSGLHRYLLRRLRSAANAEDLAQEVYLRLLRAVEPRQVKFPQAYVYQIAFHVLCEFQVRERGGRVTFDSETTAQLANHVADETATPEQAYEEEAQRRRFEQVLADLPPMQRTVLRLATQHNFSHAQIAEKLGIAVSTVRNHLYKAIDHCRHRFAHQNEERDS
jgi:RNA polymerase sigma factor (sigma-70 family)